MLTETNSKLAIWSAIGTGICVLFFGVTIFIPNLKMLAYGWSIGIAICFLIMVISNDAFVTENNRIFSNLSKSFAIIYCTLICIVYYTQISFVRLGSPSTEVLSIVAYSPPKTAYFALDILGYFFMSISVLFLSFTVEGNRLLKTSLLIMGIWGLTCVIVPLLPFLYENSDKESDIFGVIVLSLWSILFIPLSVLLAMNFHKNGKISQ
jgi:hypothetical protein